MPVLPIATNQSIGGVQLDDKNDIAAENGVIRTKYCGNLVLDENSVIAGSEATGNSVCVAVGIGSKASVIQAVALGPYSKATAIGAMALGADAKVSADYGIAIGVEATVSFVGSVAIGYQSSPQESGVVAVGSKGAYRRIVYVDDGRDFNDAVNYKQLKSLEDRIAELEKKINALK